MVDNKISLTVMESSARTFVLLLSLINMDSNTRGEMFEVMSGGGGIGMGSLLGFFMNYKNMKLSNDRNVSQSIELEYTYRIHRLE